MHGIHLSYVRYFNQRYGRSGHLFQDRFSSWVIENEKHLLATKEYIENNPVKAGVVTKKEDYQWSSAKRDGSAITIEPIII